MPRLGGADRHLDVALDVADLADELGRARRIGIADVLLAIPAQDVLVADQDAFDARILVGHADQRAGFLGIDLARLSAELQLGLVGAVDPGAGHQLETVLRRQRRHRIAAVGRAIGADVFDLAAEHREVTLDLVLAWLDLRCGRFVDGAPQEAPQAARLAFQRILVLGPGCVGDTVQGTFQIGRSDAAVEKAPAHQSGCDDNEKNQAPTHHEETIAPAIRRW